MALWGEKKRIFQKRFDELNEYTQNGFPSDMDAFKKYMSAYIEKGGVSESSSTNGDATNALKQYDQINTKKNGFVKLNDDILQALKKVAMEKDSGKLLSESGQLQQKIAHLEKQKTVSKEDAETAKEREESLRFRDKNTTSHSLFLIKNPVPRSYIPYLWAISVLFVSIGVLVFKESFPPIPAIGTIGLSSSSLIGSPVIDFLKDRRIWMALSAAFAIVIVFLSLKVANVI